MMNCLWCLLSFYLCLASALEQPDQSRGHLRPCSLLGVTMKSRSLSLSYSCPSDTASPLFPCHIANYSIMFRPNHSGEDFMVRTSFNETFLLDRLIPFTVYEIKVRALYNHSYCNSSSISPSSSTYGMTPPAEIGPPKNVLVENRTATNVTITCEAPDYENGTVIKYRVEYTGSEKVKVENSKQTKITLTNLKPYTEYTFTVKSRVKFKVSSLLKGSPEDWGEKSTEMSFRTRQAKPSSPQRVHVRQETLNSTSVEISWQRPLSPNGIVSYYIVYYRVGSRSAGTRESDTDKTQAVNDATGARLINLVPFTKYSVWVAAVNMEENEELVGNTSETEEFTTLADAPSQPRNVVCFNVRTTSVGVTWKVPAKINGIKENLKYEIFVQFGTFSYSTKNIIVNSSGTTEHHTVTELTQLSRYSLWIVAFNVRKDGKELTSPRSRVATFTTTGGPRSAPQNVSSSVSGVSAVITWQLPADVPRAVIGYRVTCVNVSDNRDKPFYRKYKAFLLRTAKLTNLVPHTQYRVEIFGYVQTGVPRYSAATYSAFHNFTTSQTAPSPPRSVQIENIYSRSVTVRWSPPLLANGMLKYYRIYLQSAGSRPPSDLTRGRKTVSVSQSQVVLDQLTPFAAYSVWVAAINVQSVELISQLSRPTEFTTTKEASSPPRSVTFSNVTSHSVIIRWSKPTTVFGIVHEYKVILTPAPPLGIKHKTVVGQNLATTVGNLRSYTRYIIHVRAAVNMTVQNSSNLLWSDTNEDKPPVNFTTKQSSPSPPLRLRSTNILSRLVWIQWDHPSRPNGEIQFYIVSLYKKADVSVFLIDLNKKSLWTVTRSNRTKNSTRRMEFSALSPYTLYGVSVRAVNVMNEVELQGNETKPINFTTKDEAPTAPSNCTVDGRNSTSISIVWQPPAPFDYKVAFYNLRVNYTSEKHPVLYSVTANSSSVQIRGLLPFKKYTVSVSAFTNNTRLLTGSPCSIMTKTTVGVPPAPRKPQLVPSVTQTENTVVLINLPTLNETNGPIRIVQVIVVELKPGASWSENMSLPDGEDSRVTVARVFEASPSSHRARHFVVGTNEDNNVQLKPNTTYAFYIRWIAQEQDSQERLESAASPAALYTTPPLQSETSTSSNKGSTVTIAVVVAGVLLGTTLAVVLIIWIRTRKRALPPRMSDKESYDLNFTTDVPLKSLSAEQTRNDTNSLPAYASCVLERAGNRRAIIEEFRQHIDKLKADDNEGFMIEFEEMAEVGVEQSIAFATNADNNNKNRYRNIVPYDGHCLMLDEVDGMDILETDYINATYIDGFSRSKEYIVAQGPLSNTCADFWRMVWIEKVEAIVMLTRTVESGKQKCFKYWSDDDTKEYEGLTIEVQLQNEMADYTVRKMKIKLLDEVRHVMHYYFRSWPDHGVPTHATDLLGLIYRVRRDSGTSNAPLVVHCSAGVGRSGTYVTIDTLLSAIESNKSIDVNSTVRKLRMKRMQMVQSVMQYILIHEAVLEACFIRKTEISTADFTKEFAKLQDFKEEFNILLKLGRPLDKSEFKTGLLPTVLRRKNRNSLFIPPDSVRVVLHVDDDSTDADYVNTEEGADYINASYVNGYYKRNLFIVTQAPLPSTLTDMWKMVFQQNATAIVNLAQPHEYQQYWPSSGSESYGHLNVNWLSSDDGKAFTVYKMQLIKHKSTRDIALFHYHGWSNDAPPSDIAGLMEMMAQLEQWQRKTQGNRMIVHCCTGVGRSGVFCAVYNVLDQTKSERIANVLHVTKVLLNQRPGIIHTPEQYEGIYSITNRYLQEGVTYANTK